MSAVLLLGGSIISEGGIASCLRSVLDCDGSLSPVVETCAFPRATLEEHLARAQTWRIFGSVQWTHVILQEQGLRPLREPDAMRSALRAWSAVVATSGARPYLFLPWRRREHDRDEASWRRIRAVHERCSREQRIALAPVGAAWERFADLVPGVALREPESNHANADGAMLTALSLRASMRGDDVENAVQGFVKQRLARDRRAPVGAEA